MTDDGETNGNEDGVEASQVLIGDDGTDDRGRIGPEGVDCGDYQQLNKGRSIHGETYKYRYRTKHAVPYPMHRAFPQA